MVLINYWKGESESESSSPSQSQSPLPSPSPSPLPSPSPRYVLSQADEREAAAMAKAVAEAKTKLEGTRRAERVATKEKEKEKEVSFRVQVIPRTYSTSYAAYEFNTNVGTKTKLYSLPSRSAVPRSRVPYVHRWPPEFVDRTRSASNCLSFDLTTLDHPPPPSHPHISTSYFTLPHTPSLIHPPSYTLPHTPSLMHHTNSTYNWYRGSSRGLRGWKKV